MATSQQHINQWTHNRAFLQTISPEFPDWAVTASFYTALHAVTSLLVHDGNSTVTSHESRNTILAANRRYQKIWESYQPLYGACRTIRYFAEPRRWVTWERLDKDILRRYLYPIEQSVQKLIGQELNLSAITLRLP
jgi:hypothetical protein